MFAGVQSGAGAIEVSSDEDIEAEVPSEVNITADAPSFESDQSAQRSLLDQAVSTVRNGCTLDLCPCCVCQIASV